MASRDKLVDKILRGTSDTDISFEGLRRVLLDRGFEERIKGSHHIFTKQGIEEILNLQPNGDLAKPYQVRQVRTLILRYKLGGSHDQV